MTAKINTLDEVVWAEGVFLGQQHFQLQTQQYQQRVELYRQMYAPQAWGLTELAFDENNLIDGSLTVTQCKGMFADGHLFSNGGQSLSLQIPVDIQTSDIYLTLHHSTQLDGLPGYTYDDNATFKAQVKKLAVGDKYDTQRQRDIFVVSPALSLTTKQENNDTVSQLKIAEVERNGKQCRLLQKFIPSVSQLQASHVLMHQLQTFIKQIQYTGDELRTRRRRAGSDATEFGHSDLAHSLLLQLVSEALAELTHYQQQTHPAQLYQCLLRIVGRLDALCLEEKLSTLSRYDQQVLTETFTPLFALLQERLRTAMPSDMVALKLQQKEKGLYVANNIDKNRLAQETFYIGVKFETPDSQWVDKFAKYAKVAAEKEIQAIVRSALPGAAIRYEVHPSSKLRVKTGYRYFSISNNNPDWEAIVNSQSLALRIAEDFHQATIDINSIMEA